MSQAGGGRSNQEIFVGRVEEQRQFRAALGEAIKPPRDETLPYVFLLYGDGGIGKTTLARRFRDIALEDKPFAGKVKHLWVDWEAERDRSAALLVGREHISAEAVLDTICTVARRADWGNDLHTYGETVKKRQEAEKAAEHALRTGQERDEWAAVRGTSAAAIARILRTGLPAMGQTGEDLSKALLDAGIKVAAEQAASLFGSLDQALRTGLGAEQYTLYLSPHEGLARALAQDLKRIAGRRALLVVLDTYEIVDRADSWLRLLIEAAGPHLLWVLSGRNNLRDSRPFGKGYFRGYAEDWPRRLVAFDMQQLALEDVKTYFAKSVPGRPLSAPDAEVLRRATRGIPLAMAQAAEMWARDVPLAVIVGDTDEATPGREIVSRMTGRYLLHVVAPEDRRALYALALAKGDLEVLSAMLRPPGEGDFDLAALLRRLERDYASVYAGEQRLHDEPHAFFELHLRAEQQRASDMVRELLFRGRKALRQRMSRIEVQLSRLEDRHGDEDWLRAAVDLADLLFWDGERAAWPWVLSRLVESLAYSRDLLRGLLEVVETWEETLSALGRDRLKAMRAAVKAYPSVEEEGELLRELERAGKLGWLHGPKEKERRAILAWWKGQWLARQGQHEEALGAYEEAWRGLPEDSERLREQLGEAFYGLASAFLWPQGASDAVRSEPGLIAAQHAAELLPGHGGARYTLGAAFYAMGRREEAMGAYQRTLEIKPLAIHPNELDDTHSDVGRSEEAIEDYQQVLDLDKRDALPRAEVAMEGYRQARSQPDATVSPASSHTLSWNDLGNLYCRDLGEHEEAIKCFQQAIDLDENYAAPRHGLGVVYTLQGELALALEAFEQSVELAPESGMCRSSLTGMLRRLGREEEAAEEEAVARPLMAQENEYNRARFAAICGNAEGALRLLEAALETGWPSRAWAAQDPELESLHGDPRFEALVGG